MQLSVLTMLALYPVAAVFLLAHGYVNGNWRLTASNAAFIGFLVVILMAIYSVMLESWTSLLVRTPSLLTFSIPPAAMYVWGFAHGWAWLWTAGWLWTASAVAALLVLEWVIRNQSSERRAFLAIVGVNDPIQTLRIGRWVVGIAALAIMLLAHLGLRPYVVGILCFIPAAGMVAVAKGNMRLRRYSQLRHKF